MKIGQIVTVSSFAFHNTAGGTGLSDWKHDPPFAGEAKVRITKVWHDYECGWRAIGTAASPDLKAYLKLNANRKDQRVFIGEFEVI